MAVAYSIRAMDDINTLRRIDQTEVPADAVKGYPRIADIGPGGERVQHLAIGRERFVDLARERLGELLEGGADARRRDHGLFVAAQHGQHDRRGQAQAHDAEHGVQDRAWHPRQATARGYGRFHALPNRPALSTCRPEVFGASVQAQFLDDTPRAA